MRTRRTTEVDWWGRSTQPELFAGTPPLEALKVIVSLAATKEDGDNDKVIMTNDVKRAYFNALVNRDVFVELPDEEPEKTPNKIGKLVRSLYGTRDAATNWQSMYIEHMESIGFTQNKGIPSVFYHKARGIRTMVHGDDYVSVGSRSEIKWFESELSKKFDIKTSVIGSTPEDQKEVKILNRIVRFTGEGVEYEADPRHVEILIQDMGLQEANPVSSPGTENEEKKEGRGQKNGGPTQFRALAARANYLAQDRPDIQFATKEVCRAMSDPSDHDWDKMKRIVRYLKGRPRMVYKMKWQQMWSKYDVFSDANWANCKVSRKSTSGGCIMFGSHCIRTWSKTQCTIATSSAESELYALVRASQEAMGLRTMLRGFGIAADISLKVDASAALSIVERSGLGRLKHVSVQWLWVQQAAKSKDIKYDKVPGQRNPADAMTKYLTRVAMEGHLDKMHCIFKEGRATTAPQMSKDHVEIH